MHLWCLCMLYCFLFWLHLVVDGLVKSSCLIRMLFGLDYSSQGVCKVEHSWFNFLTNLETVGSRHLNLH